MLAASAAPPSRTRGKGGSQATPLGPRVKPGGDAVQRSSNPRGRGNGERAPPAGPRPGGVTQSSDAWGRGGGERVPPAGPKTGDVTQSSNPLTKGGGETAPPRPRDNGHVTPLPTNPWGRGSGGEKTPPQGGGSRSRDTGEVTPPPNPWVTRGHSQSPRPKDNGETIQPSSSWNGEKSSSPSKDTVSPSGSRAVSYTHLTLPTTILV